MKKVTLLNIALVALLLVTPAIAREKEPTGNQIDILDSGPQTYPANEPFYIAHGWIEVLPQAAPGQVRFALELDDVIVKPTYVEHTTVVGDDGPLLDTFWFFNFPDGMTGTHIFKGHWTVPCVVALYFDFVEECAHRMTEYEWGYSEVTVDFLAP